MPFPMPKPVTFMSLRLQLANRKEVLDAIEQAQSAPVRIATVNPEFILETEINPQFKAAVEAMTHCTIDGSGLFFALSFWQRLRNGVKPELYHGADLVADLFEAYKDGSRKFFFIGGPPHMAEQAKEKILQRYPSLSIVGATDGGKIDPTHVTLSADIQAELEKTRPDIILVGFGAPKQELWIQAVAKQLPIPVMIGVGGTLGFYSVKKRAPGIMRQLHLEWLHRMVNEPGHWRRVWRAVVVFSVHSGLWIISSVFHPKNRNHAD